jgi:phosphate transport system protein
MRNAFRDELDAITDDLVSMCELTASAMDRATTALMDLDLDIAESVIAKDEEVDRLQRQLEERSYDLLARQQPVATDLRTIVASLRMSADVERMGDLARHIAKLARLRYPDSAVPSPLRVTILEMNQAAVRIAAKTATVIANRDVATALEIERDDDEMDRLHRALFAELLDTQENYSLETAIDVTLAGRFYERFADHAVSVANRVVYLVTGERREDYVPAP